MAGTLPTAVFALIGGGGLHGHRHIVNREGKAVQAQPGTSGSSSRTVKMPTPISSTSPYRKTQARRQGGCVLADTGFTSKCCLQHKTHTDTEALHFLAVKSE